MTKGDGDPYLLEALEGEKPHPLQMGMDGGRPQAAVSPGQKSLPVLARGVLSLGSWKQRTGLHSSCCKAAHCRLII